VTSGWLDVLMPTHKKSPVNPGQTRLWTERIPSLHCKGRERLKHTMSSDILGRNALFPHNLRRWMWTQIAPDWQSGILPYGERGT
jgi:hypothetical protein